MCYNLSTRSNERQRGDVNINILIACEASQVVCSEFRKRGHVAFSCDIDECYGDHPEWHIKQNVLPLLNGNCSFKTQDGSKHFQEGKWDMIIAHPPCTYLTTVANRHFSLKCTDPLDVIDRWQKRCDAIIFFMRFVSADCDKICIENPVGFMNSHYKKPSQVIHPYFFAKDKNDTENYHIKKTCLWLKGLPNLQKTNNLPEPKVEEYFSTYSNSYKRKHWTVYNTNATGVNSSKKRSKTFTGIAKAMASQWG